MMKCGLDPKKKAIDELMGYLDGKDDEELGSAVKPKGLGVEVTKVEKLGGEGEEMPEGEELAAVEGEAKPKMSDEEISELIEALQSKLGG